MVGARWMGQVGGRFVHATFVLVVEMPMYICQARTRPGGSLSVSSRCFRHWSEDWDSRYFLYDFSLLRILAIFTFWGIGFSCTFSAKRLQNRGIYFCKDVGYEGCWSIAPKKSKTSVLAETHLIVNETVRYNVELTHVDLDSRCRGRGENLCFRFGGTKYLKIMNTEENWANREIPWRLM